MTRRTRELDPAPAAVTPLTADGYVQTDAALGDLVEGMTPTGESRAVLLLALLVELQRATLPENREALAAKASRDRSRAAAWDALGTVLRSKWSAPVYIIIAGSLALAGLQTVGVDLLALPAIIQSVRCPP